ncbi:AdoMet-dependent rRNA methyltransferase spb1 [Schizosaccharomyces pombe]
MGKSQKKTAKGRLDKWYKLAKEQGYRSRAAFKLVQLNQKYSFLEKAKVIIDLCAAPGGWLQVASKTCKPGSLIVGVDLAPIKPIPNCHTFVEDITSDKCRSQLRGYLKTWKADVVLHDGAPNVGSAWLQDAYGQAQLVLMSMKLACEFLVAGGTFVTKVFRSRDYNNLLWVFKQLFNKVEATKPPSSRNVSAEIFVVCRGYKAPKKLDPRFTDPRTVFEEVQEPVTNVDAKVFHPEKRKRSREGYADDDYTLHKTVLASEFVTANDPIQILGTSAEIIFPKDDEECQRLYNLDVTTEEILLCCSDLQVLGKKEFRDILRWRLKIRDEMGIGKKVEDEQKTVVEEIPEMDEEERLDQELQDLSEAERVKLKRERRKANQRKQREIVRMQMGMLAPMDIGLEHEAMGEDSLFGLATAEKHGLKELENGTLPVTESVEEEVSTDNEEVEYDSDDERDRLEADLDSMYSDYTKRKAESDVKYRVKKARGDLDDEEWNGIDNGTESDDSQIAETNFATPDKDRLTTSLLDKGSTKDGLSRKARMFFDQDIFDGIEDADADVEIMSMNRAAIKKREAELASQNNDDGSKGDQSEDSNDHIEVVPVASAHDEDDDWNSDSDNDENNVEIVTAEAMTLAQDIASRRKSKADLIDEGYNRWSFQSKEGLPDWFLDEETTVNKPNKPITKEAVLALREKMKALNARPIKKVLEAQGRKKMRTIKRLQRVAKKAEGISESGDMTESEKAKEISRLVSRATKSKPKAKPTLVVAKGPNKGLKSRPKGVKGKYKMVDSRMKKDLRAQKRLAKKGRR